MKNTNNTAQTSWLKSSIGDITWHTQVSRGSKDWHDRTEIRREVVNWIHLACYRFDIGLFEHHDEHFGYHKNAEFLYEMKHL
jgi:hypothetical protein